MGLQKECSDDKIDEEQRAMHMKIKPCRPTEGKELRMLMNPKS